MEKIVSHIIELLYDCDCVIVPSLGAFVASNQPAYFDKQKGLMLPPRKEIIFNSHITHSDGTLADHVAQRDGIPYSEAAALIDAFVRRLRKSVNAGGEVLLPGLGSFSKVDDRLLFNFNADTNFLTESYGLAPVNVSTVRRSVISNAAMSDVRRVAASVAAVTALLFVSPRTSDTSFAGADLSASFLQLPSSPDVSTYDSEPFVPFGEDAREVVQNDVEAADTSLAHSERYCLVVASFPSSHEAANFIARMNQQGVTGLETLVSDGRTRVIAASYPTRQEAVNQNRSLRTLHGFEKSWVLRVDD